jgi:hypothetical protein
MSHRNAHRCPTEQNRPATRQRPDAFDASVAHSARVHDYWLGGKDNYAADRAAGDAVMAAYPGIVMSVRANRAFLARAVRFPAAEAGIRQFLDVGTGIPTASNTHEVAQAIAPDCRVVYVDYDPVVLAHARALLTSSPEGATDYIDADLRKPGAILAEAARTLDFTRPVAVMLIAVMHLVVDEDDPYGIVRTLLAGVPSGSYLALSQSPRISRRSRWPKRPAGTTGWPGRRSAIAPTTRSRAFRRPGTGRAGPGAGPEVAARSGAEARNRSAMWGGVARKT